MLRPRPDAVAAGVAVGVDVDGDPVRVVGDLARVVGVLEADAREAVGAIRARGAGALDLALDAREGGHHAAVHAHGQAHEARGDGVEARRVRVEAAVAEASK
ncbi:MAG: hypothetical protein R3A52_19745 [Polyangiales bacterium]